MTVNLKLFQFALETLAPSDWEHFERLSSAFLASEFGSLRTMAAPSGDGGRDAELFSPEGQPIVVAQYSVAKDWRTKIRDTVSRLADGSPSVRLLIYMSNHQIGAQADDLKKELLTQGLMLDPRDRNWFLERACTDGLREHAAQELVDRIARPYLEGERIIEKTTSPLTSGEARAALLYLGMQWEDDVTEKGLTKLSFDALVRAALRHSHSDNRVSRSAIHNRIFAALPSTDQPALVHETDKALTRLTKRFIRHWKKEDEFCLTHAEHQRILIRLAETETEVSGFRDTLERHCLESLKEITGAEASDVEDVLVRVPRILERVLVQEGEAFASAVLSGNLNRMRSTELAGITCDDIAAHPPVSKITHYYPYVVRATVEAVLARPDAFTNRYLRRLGNSYTLLAFLKETPDVQSATRKLCSHGTIWIDTTVLLPLFAEQLEEDPEQRRLTKVFLACTDAGVELRITSGILEEVCTHMNFALTCSQHPAGTWRGRTPYLYHQFLWTGQSPQGFSAWLSLFRGSERPGEDVALFLSDLVGMKRQNLSEESRRVRNEVRLAVERLWGEVHAGRRRQSTQIDDATERKLVEHDTETYLGVVALQQDEDVSQLGYRNWLLTRDHNAWGIRDRLRHEFPEDTPPSPIMSLSFLLNHMTFGPVRKQIGKANELSLPLILDVEMAESMPHDIIAVADKVRKENEGKAEYVIRRDVRDEIDRARRRQTSLQYRVDLHTEESNDNGRRREGPR